MRKRLWSSLRAAGAAALARGKAILTHEPGEVEDVAERARVSEEARAAVEHRALAAKRAQLRGYGFGPGAARDAQARAQLGALWDRIPARPWETIAEVLRAELGVEPEQAFESIEREPMAAASLGQVHAARWNGLELAVKVQVPGMAAAIAADLDDRGLVRELAGLPAGRGLGSEAEAYLREVFERETDYTWEARGLSSFRRAFAADPVITVPELIVERSTTRVLSQTLLLGRPLYAWKPDASLEARNRVAEALWRFAWEAPLCHGLINGDPNPGNFLVLEEGKVGFVDYGAWAEVPAEVVASERRIWAGLLMSDGVRGVEQFRHGLAETAQVAVSAFGSPNQAEWERELAAPFMAQGSFRFTPAYAERLADLSSRMLRLGELGLPPTHVLLWRARLGTIAVLGHLGAEFDARSHMRTLLAG